MFLLFLFLGILFLMMLNRSKSFVQRCSKQHKWELRLDTSDGKGYLQCRVCGKFPGEN